MTRISNPVDSQLIMCPPGRCSLGVLAACFLSFLLCFMVSPAGASSSTVDRKGLPRDLSVIRTHIASSKLSAEDLMQRQSLERSFQVAAFQQFDHHKTGLVYNVTGFAETRVQAIRLRAGSFRKYGLTFNEFSIPRGSMVSPAPERILLVYAKLPNASLFRDLPDGRSVVSSVLNLLAYDASDLNSSQPLDKLSVTSTNQSILINFPAFGSGITNTSCGRFSDDSTAVNYTVLVQNSCVADQFGTFAIVGNGVANMAPTFPPEPLLTPEKSSGRRSNTWKIIVGSIIGGLAVLVLLSLLACLVDKRRKNAKIARMEYQADQGEVLETAQVQNSRAPAAGGTRTQPGLENEFAMT